MEQTPRLALSPVTIPRCSFEDSFRVAAEAGFGAIGLRHDRLDAYLASGHTLSDVKALLRTFGLVFAEVAFLAEWQFQGGLPLICKRQRTGDERKDQLRRDLVRFLEHCQELECANITAVPALSKTGELSVAAEEFAALCDFVRPYGGRLCLEFMGTAPQISTVEAGSQLASAAARSNGGILVDTFLFHQGGSTLAQVEAVPMELVFNVQLADAKPLPREQLNMLEDRLFPGTGVAPVREVVSALSRRGYQGWWTVELFNPDYAAAAPEHVARAAYESSMGIFADASRMARQAEPIT